LKKEIVELAYFMAKRDLGQKIIFFIINSRLKWCLHSETKKHASDKLDISLYDWEDLLSFFGDHYKTKRLPRFDFHCKFRKDPLSFWKKVCSIFMVRMEEPFRSDTSGLNRGFVRNWYTTIVPGIYYVEVRQGSDLRQIYLFDGECPE
jgi:hypothetical protein